MNDISDQQRLEDLETKLAFQEDLLQALNDIVSKQDERIELMIKHLEALKAQLAFFQENQGSGLSDEIEIPPHY